MSARARYGTVTVDIDLADVLSEISVDELKAECVRRGLLPKSESPTIGVQSVSLAGTDLAEIGSRVRCGDLYGAMLRLDRILPGELRVFSDHLSGARPC